MKTYQQFLSEVKRTVGRATNLGVNLAARHGKYRGGGGGRIIHDRNAQHDIDNFRHLSRAVYSQQDHNDNFWDKPHQKTEIAHKDLIPTQAHTSFDPGTFKSYKMKDKDAIVVVKHKGKHYIWNGHHRVIRDRLLGKKSTKAHVFNIPDSVDEGVETIKESIFGPHNGIVMHRHLVKYLNPERMRQVASKFRRKEDTVIPATDIHKSLPKDLDIRLSHSTHKMLNTDHDPHGAFTHDNGEGKHEITLGVISNSYDSETLHKVFSSPAMGRAAAHEHEHYTDYKGKKAKSKIGAEVAMGRAGKASARTGTDHGDKKYYNDPMEIRAHNVDMALAAREHVGKLSHTTNIKKTIASSDLRGHAYKGFVQNVDPSKRKSINGYINRLARNNKSPST